METLSTVIKFVGAGNGGTGGGADAASAATSGVATGDISMLIAGIVLAIIGAFVFVVARRYATVATGAHAQANSKISTPIIAAFAAILLGLTLSVVGATQMRAHADTNDALQSSGDIIATVDEQTGDVSFSAVDIKNTSEKPYVIEKFQLSAAEGVTTISDVEWNIKIGDTVVYDGVAGETQVISDHITIDAGDSVKLDVGATNLSADLAKSLIGKDVATANLYYEVKYFKVDASVDDSTHGTISYSPEGSALSVKYGTQYTVDNTNNKITFGTDDDAQTITFTPASGFKLTEWKLNGQTAEDGEVTSELTFGAATESAISYYSGTVKLFSVDVPTGTGLSGAKVSFTKDGEQAAIEEVTTDSDGKFAFTTVAEKTAGTIKVTYTDATHTDDVYSVATKTTDTSTTSALGDFEIRKLTSLAVTVKSNGSNLNTHWCPAFADGTLTKSSVKFYDKNFCETDGTATANKTTDYKMSDLKDGGWYYAFVTTGVTIYCYQTTDATWDAAFKISEPTGSAQTADCLQSGFINNYCSDTTAKTVYFDGTSTEKSQWAPSAGATPSGTPTLNGVSYSTDGGRGGWYAAYGTFFGGVLSFCSAVPWSAVASSEIDAIYWETSDSKWHDNTLRFVSIHGVVLSQAFIS